MSGAQGTMTIGQIASACRVSTDTVRYYERVGLLPSPERSRSGYRLYAAADRERLDFVRRAQAVGLSLVEIRELLRDRQRPGAPEECQRVASLLRARIAQIEMQIAELEAFRRQLAENLGACEAAESAACPVILKASGARRKTKAGA